MIGAGAVTGAGVLIGVGVVGATGATGGTTGGVALSLLNMARKLILL